MRKYRVLGKRASISVSTLGQFALGMGIAVITTAIVGTILTNLQSTQTANTAAYNVTGYGLTGLITFGQWFGIEFIIGAAVFVIGLLLLLRGVGGTA